ncbi:MAG: septum formation initiator family protein [Marinilabiliales bacterium]
MGDKSSFFKKYILPVLKNKFFIASFVFIIYMFFFDADNLLDRIKNLRELKELYKQKDFYLEDIAKKEKQINELQTDNENLEKFAREKYLMKKDNEDIFVFVKRKEK